MLFQAKLSDSAGSTFDPLISCGLALLDDSAIRAVLPFQCLTCARYFFAPAKLAQHLDTHDFKQMHTYLVPQ